MQEKIKSYITKMQNASAPVKAAFWFTVCSIINKCIQLITVPIFTRILTTTEYGQYSIFVSWQSILLIIATLNIYSNVFNNGMIKYPQEQDKFLSSMQGLTTSITLVLMLVFLCFRKQLSEFIGLPVFLILILLVEIMLTPGYELWAAKQRFDFKYKKVVASTIALVVLNPLVGLLFVWVAREKGYARILSVLVVQIEIYLEFPQTLTRLTDNPYGRQIFTDQVEDKIDYAQMNIIHFPDRIVRITSSFVQGFFTEIVNHLGYDELKNHIKIDGVDEKIEESVWNNLF